MEAAIKLRKVRTIKAGEAGCHHIGGAVQVVPDPAGKEATRAARQGRLSSLGIGTGSEVPREGSPFLVGWQTDLITSGLDPVPN